jgi:hypothetical protein
MRVANFRDDVLWAIAHKTGIDPDITRNGQGIMPDQADAWVSFINSWVRRLYPSADYPQWTPINQFNVSPNHIVSWNAFTSDLNATVKIERVLKVYLVNPETTWAAVDIPFRLTPQGIHVGYEHGSSVWIKYLATCPKFTAREWDANTTYALDQPTYSPRVGQCFRSKTSGNVGHDPSTSFSLPPGADQPSPLPLPTEIISSLEPPNPGVAGQSQIVQILFPTSGSSGAVLPVIPDPPPLNARFFVEVADVNGALVGNATSMANGTDTLDLILTDLTNQLISALTGFTSVTADTDAFTIRIEDDSNFRVNQAFWGLFSKPNVALPVQQIQSYIPVIPPTDGKPQVIQFPLSDNSDQVTPGATYTLNFIDTAGVVHSVTYLSQTTDGAIQILSGLITQLQNAAQSDPFLQTVSATLDTTTPSDLFATPTAISINATMMLPGSPWWELVLLPVDLVDGCVRGTVADHLKAEGQADKGAAEEQLVPTEIQSVTGRIQAPQYDDLTDQSRQKLPK